MPSPDEPCAACPRVARGLPGPCRGLTHRRFCELAAKGEEGYIALMCDDPPRSFPPLAEQAANLAGAVGRFVASGLKRATPAEQAGRLAICGGCDRFRDGKCLECGCVTAWKARLQSEHCPIGKW